MLSRNDYVQLSLELHLFFGRTMKEHAFFLELGFTPKNANYTQKADRFRKRYDALLEDVISLSDGVVSRRVLNSGEVVTPYTIKSEKVSTYYTGVQIPTSISQSEINLEGSRNDLSVNSRLEQRVYLINEEAIELVTELIRFKENILSNVLSCNMFTVNYPLLIDHIMREAKLYLQTLIHLQKRADFDLEKEALEQETFWNNIMAEHAYFVRGLLDPSEGELIETANNFGREFDQLTEESKASMDRTMLQQKITEDSLNATKAIRDFKQKGTEGLLDCKIKSIILPLLGDHILREANHYLRLLNMYSR